MFCLQKLRQAVLLLVTYLAVSQSVWAGTGSAGEASVPIQDEEVLLQRVRSASGLSTDETDGKSRSVIDKPDILPPMEAVKYLFSHIEGLEGQVIPARDGALRFSIRNGEGRKPLNEMGFTYVVDISAYKDKTEYRNKSKHTQRYKADASGVLDIAVPLDKFRHEFANHYNLSLYFLTANDAPVLIRNADFSLVSLSPEVDQQIQMLEQQYLVSVNDKEGYQASLPTEGGAIRGGTRLSHGFGSQEQIGVGDRCFNVSFWGATRKACGASRQSAKGTQGI